MVLQRLVLELQGTPCLDLEEHTPERKSIMASRSFGRAVKQFEELQEAMAAYVTRAAEKMRRQGLATTSIVVFVTTNRHKPQEAQYYAAKPVRLTIGTADTARLIRAALWGLRSIWRPGFRYKKCGVTFLDLHPASQVQGSLFIRPDSLARMQLMLTVDALNRRYGRGSVRFAAAGIDQAWKLRSEQLSQRYTTNWTELLNV